MEIAEFFPMWDHLTPLERQKLTQSAQRRTLAAGTVVQQSGSECMGLLLISSGRLRAYLLSDEGREITLYRLFDRDICLFSASCMLHSIQFDLTIEAEKETELWVISPEVVRSVTQQSAPLMGYINELMATRFTEVMWLVEQILWKSMDKRLAGFLLEECAMEGSSTLTLTHEAIGHHLGTAREVVTRMLRYFQSEGMVELQRGKVILTDPAGLEKLQEK